MIGKPSALVQRRQLPGEAHVLSYAFGLGYRTSNTGQSYRLRWSFLYGYSREAATTCTILDLLRDSN